MGGTKSNGVSAALVLPMSDMKGWMGAVFWSGKLRKIWLGLSWSEEIDLFSSPKSILMWESWRYCKLPGEFIGCKLKPFLIDSIWLM